VSTPHSETCGCVVGARAAQAIDYLRQCWTGPKILAAFPFAVEPSRTFTGVRLRLDAPTSELRALIAEEDVPVRLRTGAAKMS